MAKGSAIIVANNSVKGFAVLAFTNNMTNYERGNFMNRAQRKHMGLVSVVGVTFDWVDHPTAKRLGSDEPMKVRSNIKLA